jgi:hypothetical protein
MQKVVEHGLKLDLHIHSYFSSAKDGKKVAKNTLENLPILVEKLNENAVNICAITDHDAFSNELYVALKQEEQADGTIQKVLPGVEFSVRFIGRSGEETVHVIAIFDDSCIYRIKLASCTENFRQVAGENLPPRRKGPPVMGSASRSGWQSVGSVIVVGNRDAILGQNSLQQLSAFQVKV